MIRQLALSIALLTAACAAPALDQSPPSPSDDVHENATGCVSDPFAPDVGGDVVAHCPPPNTQQLQAATLAFAQTYAADNSIPDPTYNVGGGCFANSRHGTTCIVVITFGGGDEIVIMCNSPDDQDSTTRCTSG